MRRNIKALTISRSPSPGIDATEVARWHGSEMAESPELTLGTYDSFPIWSLSRKHAGVRSLIRAVLHHLNSKCSGPADGGSSRILCCDAQP